MNTFLRFVKKERKQKMLGNIIFIICLFAWIAVEVWQRNSIYQDKESQMSFSWMKGFFFGGAAVYAFVQLFG